MEEKEMTKNEAISEMTKITKEIKTLADGYDGFSAVLVATVEGGGSDEPSNEVAAAVVSRKGKRAIERLVLSNCNDDEALNTLTGLKEELELSLSVRKYTEMMRELN